MHRSPASTGSQAAVEGQLHARPKDEASVETFVGALRSYGVSVVGFEISSLMRENASLWLGPHTLAVSLLRRFIRGCVNWARLGVSWLTIPMKRRSSWDCCGGIQLSDRLCLVRVCSDTILINLMSQELD